MPLGSSSAAPVMRPGPRRSINGCRGVAAVEDMRRCEGKRAGSDRITDSALLESAVAAPQASFGGKSPYRDFTEVAAAYLYYLCRNHPFVDDNKRAALGSCIVFLRLNGVEPKPDGPEWEQLVLSIASGSLDREQATTKLRALLRTTK